jgi:hypothetical protein
VALESLTSESSQPTRVRSWLTRYSTTSLPRFFVYLAGSWYLLWLAMLFLSKRDYLTDQGLRGVFVWSGVVTLPMMEASIAGLLVGATKTSLIRSRSYWRYLGFLLMLVVVTLLTISLFLFLVSWTAASQPGFVTYSSIRSCFTDLSLLLPVLTFRERALVTGARLSVGTESVDDGCRTCCLGAQIASLDRGADARARRRYRLFSSHQQGSESRECFAVATNF